MAVPEAALRVVGIRLVIAVRVMTDMVGTPFEHGGLKGPTAGNQERAFTHFGQSKLRCVISRWYPTVMPSPVTI